MSTADQSLPRPDAGAAPVPTKLYVDVYDPMYPDADGQPMAEGTQQFDWIVTIKEGLEALFQDVADVFVAGDLLWYFTEGQARDCVAPDAMVVFGRPKGARCSYRQWVEGGVVPQVVFEVYSPTNTAKEMAAKQRLYERLGVLEYNEYDPRTGSLKGWLREGDRMSPIAEIEGWRSPRLGVTFEAPAEPDALVIRRPDGVPFVTAARAIRERDEQAARADEAERRSRAEHKLAQAAHRRAERAEDRAEQAEGRIEAQRERADEAVRLAEESERLVKAERERAELLAAKLRAMGVELD